jgi:hypothetical protein
MRASADGQVSTRTTVGQLTAAPHVRANARQKRLSVQRHCQNFKSENDHQAKTRQKEAKGKISVVSKTHVPSITSSKNRLAAVHDARAEVGGSGGAAVKVPAFAGRREAKKKIRVPQKCMMLLTVTDESEQRP